MRKKNKTLFFILLFLVISAPPLSAQDYSSTKVISIEKNPELMSKIKDMNLDFLMEWGKKILINATFEDLARLEMENIPFMEEALFSSKKESPSHTLQGGLNGAYHSYSEIEQDLLILEASHPDLARVHDIGDSLENRNIYALKISDNVNIDEEEAEVVFLGCHHAREWISVEIPFLLGKYLLENYRISPEVRELVNQSEIWIIPLVNPDGLEYSIHFYRYWRKNRRDNGDGSYGVDLNRNYAYKWGFDENGSSSSTGSVVFRGKSTFSEPETQTIQRLFSQKSFQALISYHSYSQIILYPWGYTHEPSEKEDLLNFIALQMSNKMQSVNGCVYEYGPASTSLYLTNGDTTDWAFGIHGIPSYTIELPPVDQIYGGFFNAEKDIQDIFKENLPAALYLIDWAINEKENTAMQKKKKQDLPISSYPPVTLDKKTVKIKNITTP